jgi:hypothetical protein
MSTRAISDLASSGYEVHYYVRDFATAKSHAEQVAALFPGKTKFVKHRRELTFSDRPGRICYLLQEDLEHMYDRPLAVFVDEGVGD